MNKEQVFVRLEELFTGEPGKQSPAVREYWKLAPQEGLAKAEDYLKSARRGQQNCTSDWAYWMYEGDITLATVLVAIFKRLSDGNEDFPDLPGGQDLVLMDKTAALQAWAGKLGAS